MKIYGQFDSPSKLLGEILTVSGPEGAVAAGTVVQVYADEGNPEAVVLRQESGSFTWVPLPYGGRVALRAEVRQEAPCARGQAPEVHQLIPAALFAGGPNTKVMAIVDGPTTPPASGETVQFMVSQDRRVGTGPVGIVVDQVCHQAYQGSTSGSVPDLLAINGTWEGDSRVVVSVTYCPSDGQGLLQATWLDEEKVR